MKGSKCQWSAPHPFSCVRSFGTLWTAGCQAPLSMGFFITPPKAAHCVRTRASSCRHSDRQPRDCSHTFLPLSKTANKAQQARSVTNSNVLHATWGQDRGNCSPDACLVFWSVRNIQGAASLPSLHFTKHYRKFYAWTLFMTYVHSRLVQSNGTSWGDGIFCTCAIPYRAITTCGYSVFEVWPGWLRSSVLNIVCCKWAKITTGGYRADATPLSSRGSSDRFYFLGSKITAEGDCRKEIKRRLLLGRKAMTKLDSMLKKKKTHHFADKSPSSQSYGFSSSHVGMWEVDYKESWVLKNRCFRTAVLEKTFESPLDCKEIKWVNPIGNHPWIFIGRTDAEAPTLWPPDMKNLLIGKDTDAEKNWRQEEKGLTEDEMVGWHHWLSGHEFKQTSGSSGGQRRLACYSPRGCKESDMT